ncbi:MAG: hydrogenase maturation protease [Desulfobacterium sp.]
MKNRIICLGNRLMVHDRAGLLVYDQLSTKKLPGHTELIEGGISGLNLLRFLENAATVVFVDTVSGFTDPGGMVVLTQQQIEMASHPLHYGHDAGLAYLLAMMPQACEMPLPRNIFMVGLEGQCSEKTINNAATLALSISQLPS